MPRSRSTTPGAPAHTVSSRSGDTRASHIKSRTASAILPSATGGATCVGVVMIRCARRSPRRSAIARRVRVGPRSMPATKPCWALNSISDGRRPPREGPVPTCRVETTRGELRAKRADRWPGESGRLDQLGPRERPGRGHGNRQQPFEITAAQSPRFRSASTSAFHHARKGQRERADVTQTITEAGCRMARIQSAPSISRGRYYPAHEGRQPTCVARRLPRADRGRDGPRQQPRGLGRHLRPLHHAPWHGWTPTDWSSRSSSSSSVSPSRCRSVRRRFGILIRRRAAVILVRRIVSVWLSRASTWRPGGSQACCSESPCATRQPPCSTVDRDDRLSSALSRRR